MSKEKKEFIISIVALIGVLVIFLTTLVIFDKKAYKRACEKIPHEFIIEEEILESYFLNTNISIEELEELDKGEVYVLVRIWDNGIVSMRRCLLKVKKDYLFNYSWKLERVV